ncbi:hypothetical protein LT493_22140 [Streptomyces tricolor]|nr:hypothetical protein [Streptomyces tricolor]
MTRNQLPGRATIAPSTPVHREPGNDGLGFGFNVSVVTDPARTLAPSRLGTYGWTGVATTTVLGRPGHDLTSAVHDPGAPEEPGGLPRGAAAAGARRRWRTPTSAAGYWPRVSVNSSPSSREFGQPSGPRAAPLRAPVSPPGRLPSRMWRGPRGERAGDAAGHRGLLGVTGQSSR